MSSVYEVKQRGPRTEPCTMLLETVAVEKWHCVSYQCVTKQSCGDKMQFLPIGLFSVMINLHSGSDASI